MKVLVLGAYGLIGLEISRALLRAGHQVTGLARSAERGHRLLPQAEWIGADISRLTAPQDWAAHLSGIDAVVNASGALQSGRRDNLATIQRDAIKALIAACEMANILRYIQISAPGAELMAKTEFMQTKAEADAALRASTLRWVILKPGLVISASAYGGTSLIRSLSAFPLILPFVLPDARIQTVAASDVAMAALRCLEDQALTGQDFDLIEPESHSLLEVLLAFRGWLGFSPPRAIIQIPAKLGSGLAAVADLAGQLGWRSPLRSTALDVLEDGVTGDPAPWMRATGAKPMPLAHILEDLPATLQERLYARLMLLFPLLVLILSVFWITSGLIGLWQQPQAVAIVAGVIDEPLASLVVYGAAALDILIGIGLLLRRWVRPACYAAIAVSIGYLAAATALLPHLWVHPLGPLVKIIPAMLLALVVAVLAEER